MAGVVEVFADIQGIIDSGDAMDTVKLWVWQPVNEAVYVEELNRLIEHGPRSVYDEAKRFSEAITMAYHRTHGVDTRIVRIFNTYGERMRINDGRAIPAFMSQAIRGEDVTVFGDGTQTRSLCYVSDLVEGIFRLISENVSA